MRMLGFDNDDLYVDNIVVTGMTIWETE